MPKIRDIAIGLALTGATVGMGAFVNPVCNHVQLDFKDQKACVKESEYSEIKGKLIEEFNDRTKAYDFSAESYPVLIAVINRELKEKNVRFDKGISKTELRQKLLTLLQ